MSEPVHARLAPSSASRWSVCTASVKFVEDNAAILPPNGSVYADEGTKAHALAAEDLLTNKLMFTPGDSEAFEMQGHAHAFADWVRSYRKPGMTLWVEKRVPLFYLPEQKGTTDACVFGDNFIFIGDLKYGAGVSVDAENNKQLATYAESTIRVLEQVIDIQPTTPVVLGIFQPRDRNNPEPIRLWTLTRAELAKFCEQLQEAADTILQGRPTVFLASPDRQCRFCPAKGICKHYAAHGLEAIVDDDTPVDLALSDQHTIELPSPNALTRNQRQRVLQLAPGLTDWLEAVKAQEIAELSAGAEPLLFKLVEGKSNRRWRDEGAAQKLLRNHLSADQTNPPSDLISPAQAEKLLKATGVELSTKFQNRLTILIEKPAGKPTLVPVTDNRPALVLNSSDGLTSVYEGI